MPAQLAIVTVGIEGFAVSNAAIIAVPNASFETPSLSSQKNPWTSGSNGDTTALPSWVISTAYGNA